jgi:hypothetical protein
VTTPRRNPYASDQRADQYGVEPFTGPDPANYSEDSINPGAAGAWDNTGWAPKLTRDDYSGVTDPTRVDELPRHDRRANLRNPWKWWARQDEDTRARHSVETVDANGFEELKGERTRAPHPLWVPPPEPRPTTGMSPHTYVFERPFDQDIARRFTGAHISLADNRRNYEILTMSPVPSRRNTYRVEPSPWDTDIVDEVPAATEGRPSARLKVPTIPPVMMTRNYRLG